MDSHASLNVPMAARNAVVGLIEVADGRGSVANAISAQALTVCVSVYTLW